MDLRPLPPVDRQAGPEPVRLERDRRRRAGHRALRLTTAVTCPTVRIHPAIIAQAAATSAVLCQGRFRLGVGTGEALNEHILGAAGRPPTTGWRCSRRRSRSSAPALEGERVVPSRQALHASRTRGSTRSPRSRRRSRSRRSAAEAVELAGPHRRRLRHDHAGRRPPRRVPSPAAGGKPSPWPAARCAGRPDEDAGRRSSPTGSGRTHGVPGELAQGCRAPPTSSRPPSRHRGDDRHERSLRSRRRASTLEAAAVRRGRLRRASTSPDRSRPGRLLRFYQAEVLPALRSRSPRQPAAAEHEADGETATTMKMTHKKHETHMFLPDRPDKARRRGSTRLVPRDTTSRAVGEARRRAEGFSRRRTEPMLDYA